MLKKIKKYFFTIPLLLLTPVIFQNLKCSITQRDFVSCRNIKCAQNLAKHLYNQDPVKHVGKKSLIAKLEEERIRSIDIIFSLTKETHFILKNNYNKKTNALLQRLYDSIYEDIWLPVCFLDRANIYVNTGLRELYDYKMEFIDQLTGNEICLYPLRYFIIRNILITFKITVQTLQGYEGRVDTKKIIKRFMREGEQEFFELLKEIPYDLELIVKIKKIMKLIGAEKQIIQSKSSEKLDKEKQKYKVAAPKGKYEISAVLIMVAVVIITNVKNIWNTIRLVRTTNQKINAIRTRLQTFRDRFRRKPPRITIQQPG
jgi:hypothetical protein